MGFFNFVETFFFLSLAMTFVLIMMLVYHFKDRLTASEQKCDTMFEIMNNMVKEMNIIKQMQHMQTHTQPLSQLQTTPISMNFPLSSTYWAENTLSESIGEIVEVNHLCNEEDESSDDDESGDDEEDESSDDDDDDVSDNESDNDDESLDEPSKIVVSDDEFEPEMEDDKSTIKIVHVDIGDQIDTITDLPVEDAGLGVSDEYIVDEIIVEPEVEEIEEVVIDSTESNNAESEIIVKKLDAEVDTSLTTPLEKTIIQKELYKKMDINALKALVISKGLTTDVKKLKKQELINILETAEE